MGYVAENIGKTGPSGVENSELNDMDLINKILSMSGDKMFEIGSEEQVFELEGQSKEEQVAVSFPAGGQSSASNSHSKRLTEDDFLDNDSCQVTKNDYLDTHRQTPPTNMMQLDGADDNDDEETEEKTKSDAANANMRIAVSAPEEADLQVSIPQVEVASASLMCEKCGHMSISKALHQGHIMACPDVVRNLAGVSSLGVETKKRKLSDSKPGENETTAKTVKVTTAAETTQSGPSSTSTDNSPKKDFSIAGLMSPQDQQAMAALAQKGEKEKTPKTKADNHEGDYDDDVVILPSPTTDRKSVV